jgi:protein-tyrosine-phosphatase
MAAGFARHLAGTAASVYSGGSDPAAFVNPTAVAAMAERGIDITTEPPQRWTDAVVAAADVVITMGCGDECPLFPGVEYEDWPLTDPAGLDLDAVRPIRDEIETKVRTLLSRLGVKG